MAISGKKILKKTTEKCVHEFYDTKKKGVWHVEATPTNNRGENKFVDVPVTVFKCRICGETKEYPDYWEHNYLNPNRTVKKGQKTGKITKKTKVAKA